MPGSELDGKIEPLLQLLPSAAIPQPSAQSGTPFVSLVQFRSALKLAQDCPSALRHQPAIQQTTNAVMTFLSLSWYAIRFAGPPLREGHSVALMLQSVPDVCITWDWRGVDLQIIVHTT